MLKKIGKQALSFIFPRSEDLYSTGKSLHLDRDLAESRRLLPESRLSPDVQKMFETYLKVLETPRTNPSHSLGFPILAWFARALVSLCVWLQATFFLLIVIVWLSPKARLMRTAGLAAAAVLTATYGNVLTMLLVHSLEITRYRTSYIPGFLLGLAMIISFLIIFAFERSRLR